jgi:hypothetical protein
MGLQLHPVQNVVNVQWTPQGIFAATRDTVGRQNPCALVYGKAGATTVDWTPLGALGIGEGGALLGCSVGGKTKNDDGTTTGTTTFVAVGKADEGDSETAGPYGSVIFTSTDGKDWTNTYKKIDVVEDDNISTEEAHGVVWDEGDRAFYVSMFAQENDIFSERIYKSTDGMSWGLAEQVTIDRESVDPREVDSILLKHCKKPENVGGKHPPAGIAKMPDGYQAYNESADVFMRPKDLKRFSAQGLIYDLAEGQDQLSPTLMIRRPGEEEGQYVEENKNIGAPCFAVANFGAAWIAGGGESNLDESFDKGDTWQSSYTHSGDTILHYNICAIAGGKPDKS